MPAEGKRAPVLLAFHPPWQEGFLMQNGQSDRRALIFANGEQINLEAVRAQIQPGDFRVAADGGLRHLRSLGLDPDLVIGDLDSLAPEEVEQLKKRGVQVEQHPVHKDETDLELALDAVRSAGYTTVLILGALGGRLDMTLGNIFLLGLSELAGMDVRLEDGMEEVFLISSKNKPGEGGGTINGQPGDRVSLLPLGGPASGVRTADLYYPLRGETLYPERTRGISNRMVATQARVTLDEGQLLCIHTRQPFL
jgi:thiamine pyrophosphokinase